MKPEECMLTVDQLSSLFAVSHDTIRRQMKRLGVEGEPRLGAVKSATVYPAAVVITKLREHSLERQAEHVERYVANLEAPK